MTWRYLSSDGVSAASGLAEDEAVMATHGRSSTSEHDVSLRLYNYRAHCGLVGRYQNLAGEINVEFCEANDVDVGRRPTGGGAILMGPGQLGIAVVGRARAERTPRELLGDFSRGVIAGLAEFGIDAAFCSKNDLEVEGRKIAGLGLHLDADGAVLFHASVLADLDIPLMLQVLNIPGAKVSDKAVAHIGERVTTISRQIDRPLTASDARPAFRRGFESAFEVETVDGALSDVERARRETLVETKYAAESWTHQRSPRRDARGSATLKTPEGLVRVYVGTHGDVMNSVLICGDFNVLPPGISRLEAALRWSRADPARVLAETEAMLTPSDLGVAPADVARTISEAADRALELERSHPVRNEGACYAPNPGETTQGSRT